MRKRNKRLIAGAAALLAAGVAVVLNSGTASADPGVASYTGSHGRLVSTVYNPANRSQFVQLAVDAHYGFAGSPDSTADSVSSVGRISKGSGAVRVAVDQLRVGAEDGSFIFDDFKISGNAAVRNNGLVPAVPLNSGTASQALGYGDWRAVPKCDGPRVAVRAYFSVRWADGSLSHPSLRSNYTQPNGTVCGPAPAPVIHATSPFRPLDNAVYSGPTTPQVTSTRSRIVNSNTADLVRVSGEAASAGGASLESNNLGVTLATGSVLSVDYQVLDGASTTSGAVRLFVYCGEESSTPSNRPAGAPDYVAVAPDGSAGGTLSVTTTASCVAGYTGLVYDASNTSTGRVRFTNLQVNDTLVSFL